mgnify:CR=1 FL=1
MARPTVWVDNDLSNVLVRIAHITNLRDFCNYLDTDFCWGHYATHNLTHYTTDNAANRVTHRSAHYTSNRSVHRSSNNSSYDSGDGGC